MANLEEKNQLETESKSVNPFSRRWILSYVGFLGFVFLYATRVNIAVAIICMVKSSVSNNTLSTSNDTVDDQDIVEEACGGLEQSLTGVQIMPHMALARCKRVYNQLSRVFSSVDED